MRHPIAPLAAPRRLLALAAFVLAGPALAGPATYHVTVDTGALAGTQGSLDFNFGPGPFGAQAATASVDHLLTDGHADGSAVLAGDAQGSLPGALALDNGAAFNDVFQAFTYGRRLSFDVALSGPALQAPDGQSLSGSSFAFSLFGDPAGTRPVLTTDTVDGFGYVIDIGLDGRTAAHDYLITSPVPEPSSGALVLAAVLLWAGCARGRRQVSAPATPE